MWKRIWTSLGIWGVLVGGAVGSAFGWTNAGGGDHGGEDWMINQPSVEIAGVHTNIGTFRIHNGKTALVKAYDGSNYGYVEIHAKVIEIAGTLQGSALGGGGSGAGGDNPNAGGGGGYGGRGGTGWNGYGGKGGATYGESGGTGIHQGSNGGDTGIAHQYPGAKGGARIKLIATTSLSINGSITANGGTNIAGGGGSGGGIYLQAPTITHSGLLQANGGNTTGAGGAGGGGRIKLYYTTLNGSGTSQVNGGRGGSGWAVTNGQDGTITHNGEVPATLIRVKKDGTGDFTTITAAINSIPYTLPTAYIVEIQDSKTYKETVQISKSTSSTKTLTIRAQTGQTPTVVAKKKYSGAITLYSHYVTVEGLNLQGGSRKYGLYILRGNYNTVRNCAVYGARDWETAGIYVRSGRYNEIVGNTVHDNDNGIVIYDDYGDNNTIRNNVIYNNRNRGIWIYRYADNNLVVNNTLYHNGKEIHLGHGKASYYDPGNNNTFRNNVMYVRSNGTCIAVDRYRDPGTLPTGTLSDYNDLYAAESGAHLARVDNTLYDTLEDWQSGSGQDLHSLSSDPWFVDAAGSPPDFHLQSTAGSYHGGVWTPDDHHSPCIDAGDPSDEYEDEPDPNGDRINMGGFGNTAQASKSGAAAPQGEFNAAAQKRDGSGKVDVSIEVSHPGGRDTKAKIEWSDAEGGSYARATLLGPATADHEDSGGPPDVSNDSTYQVGSGENTRVITSEGSNTVTFDWDSATDLPNGDGTYWLKLTVNDDRVDQRTPDKISMTIDHAAPSGLESFIGRSSTTATITWGWTAVSSESHFDHYEIWYGMDRDDVLGRTGTAAEWDDKDDAALGTMSSDSTTIAGLKRNTLYYAKIWAVDRYGNQTTTSDASYATATVDTVTHYVATTGSDPGEPNDPLHPWRTIQRAVNDIPDDLPSQHTYYIVQVQDSGTYAERVKIQKTTDSTYTITLRPAEGQTPTIQPPNGKDGIWVKSSYVTIEGFAIEASNRYGIYVYRKDHTTIRNCTVYGGTASGGGGIKLYKSDYNRMVGNRIYGNRIGIHLAQDADFNSIRNNLIYLDTESEVYVDVRADSDTLINNAIGGYARGLHVRNRAGDHHVVRNNIFYELDFCIYLEKALENTFDQCDYNDLHPKDGGKVGYLSGTTYETLTEWRAASGLDPNSISEDPLFADVSGDPGDMDLHLKSQAGRWNGSIWVIDPATSPCIDAGDPSDDYSNEPDPNGNRINMGAYGNTAEASKSGLLTLYKGGIPYGEYVMGGVPLIPVHGNPDSVLSDDFGGNPAGPPEYWWRLVRWDTEAGKYIYYNEPDSNAYNPPDFTPGRGYWLIQWWSMAYDGMTEGDTISVTGYSVPLNADFVIPLKPPRPVAVSGNSDAGRGLNQLANPFVFSMDWKNAKIRENTTGRVLTILEAARARWVDGYAYRWDWKNDQYVPISPEEGGMIERWFGFWMEQLHPRLDLSLLLPPVRAEEASRKPLAPARPSPTDWYVQFSVACSLLVQTDMGTDTVWYKDEYNRIGVKPDASREYDAYDAVDLPIPTEHYVYVFFPHDDPEDPETYWLERPGRYTYDLRDPEWHDAVWTFVVQTDLVDTEMTWTWTNPGSVPRGYRVALEDGDADRVIVSDIREMSSYTFSSGTYGKRTFRLHAVYEDVTGDVTGDRTVSAYDATLILRYVVGLESLPDFALELANVSGNAAEDPRKAVTPYDAALILRYAVGLTDDFPADRGEAPKPTGTERVVYLADLRSRADGTLVVPLLIDEMDGVLSGRVRVSFDAARMEIEDVVAAELISGYLSAHTVGEGCLTFAFAGARSARGGGTFAEIVLRPKRAEREIAGHLHLDTIQLNEGLIRAGISSARPDAYYLYPNFPNPFNPNTTIRFDVPVRSSVTLSIYNAIGQRVRTLVRDDREAGAYAVIWDSRDEDGRPVASGVYFCRMEVGRTFSRAQRMVLLK